jgi:hypothetical protein
MEIPQRSSRGGSQREGNQTELTELNFVNSVNSV